MFQNAFQNCKIIHRFFIFNMTKPEVINFRTFGGWSGRFPERKQKIGLRGYRHYENCTSRNPNSGLRESDARPFGISAQARIIHMAAKVPEYDIRLMRKEDIPGVLDLWRETGIPEGTYSINTWFEYDPDGFYVAVAKDGTVLGSLSGVLQDKDLGFLGLYTVKSTFQGRGIGRNIWKKVMERIGDRNVGCNPAPQMRKHFRDREGLSIQCDWLSVVCVAQEVPTSEMISELPGIEVGIVQHDDADIEKAVSDFDGQVFGFHRGPLVSIHCHERDSITVVASKSIDGSVCGYGTVKKNIKGNALVGPLYADDKCIAELILYHLVRNFPIAQSKGVTLMTIDCNENALEMVERLGFEKRREIARLYRREEVNAQFRKVFAQHNLNFSVF